MSGWCPVVFTTVPQGKVFDFWGQLIPSHARLKRGGGGYCFAKFHFSSMRIDNLQVCQEVRLPMCSPPPLCNYIQLQPQRRKS